VISHKAITDSDIKLDDDVVYFDLNIELKDKINDIEVQELYSTEFLTPFNFLVSPNLFMRIFHVFHNTGI
jgi:hypothetical protein